MVRPYLRREIADPAAQRQAADAGRRDEPARHGQAEGVGGVVDVAPEAAAVDPHGAVRLVDPDALQPRQIDDEAPVADAETRAVVPAAAHREQQLLARGRS